MIPLAVGFLVTYGALGTWAPWKDSDQPELWLLLAGVCGYGAAWFGLPLFVR